jgi:hypothetical protein
MCRGALRASAHEASRLVVKRLGRGPAAVEHLINASGVERSALRVKPSDHRA